MERGNRAILEHEANGKALRVFEGARGTVRYLGEFTLADPPFYFGHAPETGGGPIRKVIIFRMRPERPDTPDAPKDSDKQYSRANENPQTPLTDPFARDPNELDRALAAHAKTQNALHDSLNAAGVTAWSPAHHDPDFDLAWSRKGCVYVCEVKSLPEKSEARQLRLGLGQVLDYEDTLLGRSSTVKAVLAVEKEPQDRRWIALCARHGVTLVWPGVFGQLTG